MQSFHGETKNKEHSIVAVSPVPAPARLLQGPAAGDVGGDWPVLTSTGSVLMLANPINVKEPH